MTNHCSITKMTYCSVPVVFTLSLLLGLVTIGESSGQDAVVDLIPVLTKFREVPGDDVVVNTKHGLMRGRRRDSGHREARGITTTVDWFLGMRYAAPPTGRRRFKEPEELESWTGIRNATSFGRICPQVPTPQPYMFNSSSMQDEDCLYLNVYAPFEPWAEEGVTYPVMVYIHGGSYQTGTGNTYLGHVLALHGVVVVTINYRLGLLGFLCSEEDGLPGNLGIRDQIQALHWVKDNIAEFRGDPGRVTLAGNGAGAWSVGLLSASPLAAGLFQRAIALSGSVLSYHAFHRKTADMRAQLNEYASAMGCDVTPDRQSMLDCMEAVDWNRTVINPKKRVGYLPNSSTLALCLDGHVLAQTPRQQLIGGSVHVTSVMIGVVANEWGRQLGQYYRQQLEEGYFNEETYQLGTLARGSFNKWVKGYSEDIFSWGAEATDAIRYEYTNWTRTKDEIEIRQQYANLIMDSQVLAPSIEQANSYYNANVPVYFYNIDHHSRLDTHYPQWVGSYNGMEMNYVFGAPYFELDLASLERQSYTEKDRVFSRQIMRWWTNYIKFGNPTPSSQIYNDPEWRRYFPSTTDYYYLSADYTEMRSHFRTRKVAFWNQFIPAIADTQDGGGQGASGSGDAGGYSIEMWILVALCGLLLILVVVLFICHQCARRRCKKQKKTCQLMHGGIITLKFDEP